VGAQVNRYAIPDILVLGEDSALELDLYTSASARLTCTAPTTVQLLDGSEEVVAAVAPTTLGPPASYTVPAAVTEDRNPSDRLRAVWRVTVSGASKIFTKPVFLVRYPYQPSIIDTDLTCYDSDLLNLLPSGSQSLEKWREEARVRIEGDLISKGRRADLVIDAWSLRVPHIELSLALFYADQDTKISDARFKDAAAKHLAAYDKLFGALTFRYDGADSGLIQSSEREAGPPVLILSSGRGARMGPRVGSGR
jgi:hypothetical protein